MQNNINNTFSKFLQLQAKQSKSGMSYTKPHLAILAKSGFNLLGTAGDCERALWCITTTQNEEKASATIHILPLSKEVDESQAKNILEEIANGNKVHSAKIGTSTTDIKETASALFFQLSEVESEGKGKGERKIVPLVKTENDVLNYTVEQFVPGTQAQAQAQAQA